MWKIRPKAAPWEVSVSYPRDTLVWQDDIGGGRVARAQPGGGLGELDAVPVKCHTRRYASEHKVCLASHFQEMEHAGLLYRNPRSRLASPPRNVAKKEPGQYRMTVDTQPVNVMTEPMP